MRDVLRRVAEQGNEPGLISFRSHHFARMIRGMWACCDPACEVAERSPDELRTIGRLYPIPTARCECGARVLELLYCNQCGEVSLGGFVSVDDQDGDSDGEGWYLSALPSIPPAELEPRSGVLQPAPRGQATGTIMTMSHRVQDIAPRRVPALPERGLRCETAGSNRDPRRLFRGTIRSPIRAHTTGAARVNQVLLDRVVRNVAERPQDGRTIIFTDSRDDAAATAAAVEANHFHGSCRHMSRPGEPS